MITNGRACGQRASGACRGNAPLLSGADLVATRSCRASAQSKPRECSSSRLSITHPFQPRRTGAASHDPLYQHSGGRSTSSAESGGADRLLQPARSPIVGDRHCSRSSGPPCKAKKKGVARTHQGLDAYRATGAALAFFDHFGLLGSALIELGTFKGMLTMHRLERHRGEAMSGVSHEPSPAPPRGEPRWTRNSSPDAVEAHFQRSIEIAKKQKSKAWELRSTMKRSAPSPGPADGGARRMRGSPKHLRNSRKDSRQLIFKPRSRCSPNFERIRSTH